MTETMSENSSGDWRKFLRKHWSMVTLFAAVAVVLCVGAILIYLWFVGDAQSTGLVPRYLVLWTMNHLITFILYLIFWEILFIGIPVIIGGALGYLWWRRLPAEEKQEYQFPGSRSRTTRGGGSISFLLFIGFCIKVYLDGNWNVAIAVWSFDYLVYSMITVLVWMAVIFGIPATIGVLWWLSRELRKP